MDTAARIRLASYEEADAPRLWQLIQFNRQRLIESFPILLSSVNDEDSARQFILALIADRVEKKRYGLGIRDLANSGKLIGHCLIREIDWSVPKAEIGYWIDAAYEGQGYMREAIERLLEFAFDELAMRKLLIRTVPENPRSQALALKCGFVKEGYLRDDFKTGTGVVCDSVYFGLTLADFRAIQTQ